MAEFCKCGSLILSDKCSNKNCTFRTEKTVSAGKGTVGVSSKSTKEKKSKASQTNPSRRSSRCVTYKLSDFLGNETRQNHDGYHEMDDDIESIDEERDTRAAYEDEE